MKVPAAEGWRGQEGVINQPQSPVPLCRQTAKGLRELRERERELSSWHQLILLNTTLLDSVLSLKMGLVLAILLGWKEVKSEKATVQGRRPALFILCESLLCPHILTHHPTLTSSGMLTGRMWR